jgi:acetoin utilization deacetylase AcuC-like enzyme
MSRERPHVILYSHEACATHDTGAGHPESIARLGAVLNALSGPRFERLDRREAPEVQTADIERVHTPVHIEAVFNAIPDHGSRLLDSDTVVSAGSGDAALRAAGAVTAAVDAVMKEEGVRAFCAVRPPGHHAEPDQAMGFCLFNNIAIGAKRALDVHGARRVAVIDFDVHHGNGTQTVALAEPRLFFASTHQSPLYPGTGYAHETGANGNVLNVPLTPGAGSEEFRAAYAETILPALERFAPDLILISAGFDAHTDDPLANLNLTDGDYAWVTTQLVALAERHCAGRVVSTLEGGYDLAALGRSAAAHVWALMTPHS